jgi:release factor glutamine methyltransferase
MEYPKKLHYGDLVFLIDKQVYEPAEDTFLLAENLRVEEKEAVLDMGTGCGILAVLATEKAKKVVATDINPHAIKCAEKNSKMNRVEGKIEFRLGDLFQPIRPDETFGLILFNAPYLPSELAEERSWIRRAWAGGPSGREIIDRFITEALEFLKADGKISLVQSSLSDIDKTMERFYETGLKARIVAEVEFPFEKIALVEARSCPGLKENPS